MNTSKNNKGACALIFPEDAPYTSAMLVSTPPPEWLDGRDLSKISILEGGLYCVYLLFLARNGAKARLSVNGRAIPGSAAESTDGVICTSAVCSIRDAALPCTLGVIADDSCRGGIFLVVRCKI